MISILRQQLSLSFNDGRLYAILAAGGFSMKAIFVKLGYAAGPVDAVTLLALRMAFALPLFLLLLRLSGRGASAPALTRGDIGRVWLLACLGYYLSSLFDFKGLVYISAGLERLILYIYPTLVVLAQAWMARQRPQAGVMRALAICYAGLAIAFIHDLLQAGEGANVLTGAGWIFASAVTYALYYLGTGAVVWRLDSMRLAGLAGSASCVLVLLHFVLLGNPQSLNGLPPAVWGYAALMALFSTVLPVWWLSVAIQRLGVGPAATIGTLGPVLTILFACLLLGEPLAILQLLGLGLVVFGITRLKPDSKKDSASPQG